jgi:hypothetical protein
MRHQQHQQVLLQQQPQHYDYYVANNGANYIPPQPPAAMSPQSRATKNLQILHRHDPSIHTVLAQFPLVALYYIENSTGDWETMGCEGPMFIFERSVTNNLDHKYGFVILNRTGVEDYFEFLDKDDMLEDDEGFLFYKKGSGMLYFVV